MDGSPLTARHRGETDPSPQPQGGPHGTCVKLWIFPAVDDMQRCVVSDGIKHVRYSSLRCMRTNTSSNCISADPSTTSPLTSLKDHTFAKDLGELLPEWPLTWRIEFG